MNTRFGFFPYSSIYYKAAQTCLDRRAEQGWALDHIYLYCIARYRRQEQPSHFVDLNVQKDYWDENTDYFQLCSDAGWELVQKERGMLLFRAAPGKSPAPIQTDSELELERFRKLHQPIIWPILLTLALISLFAIRLYHQVVPWLPIGLGTIGLLIILTIAAWILSWKERYGKEYRPHAQSVPLTLVLVLPFAVPLYLETTPWLTSNFSIVSLLFLLSIAACGFLCDVLCWRYVALCRRSGRVEAPGAISIFLDAVRCLLIPVSLLIIILPRFLPIRGVTVDLHWNPLDEEYSATVDACQEWPVLMAADLDLPAGEGSRHLTGRCSVLMDYLLYLGRIYDEDPNYPLHKLATERFDCSAEFLAKLVIAKRKQETQTLPAFALMMNWKPAPGLGFDESYTCYDGSYLLIRQGKVVALVGCTGLDLTTEQNLALIRARVLDGP